MKGTSPPILSIWSGPAAPNCCLASKSQARLFSERLQSQIQRNLGQALNGLGSTIYQTAWKPHTTPLGRVIFRVRASARRISGKELFSGPSICDLLQVRDGKGGAIRVRKMGINLDEPAQLASWGTPLSNHANGEPEAFLERKRRSMERGSSSMGVSLTDLNMQAKAWLRGSPSRLTASGEMLTGCYAKTKNGGPLNPEHSRWLMGYPVEWGYCGAMAMQSIRGRQKSSSNLSLSAAPKSGAEKLSIEGGTSGAIEESIAALKMAIMQNTETRKSIK